MRARKRNRQDLLCVVSAVVVASATLAHAQDLRPGEQVRSVERDQHLPAHPGPGDTRVSLRFVSGSQATVLAINAATGWLGVRGEPLEDTFNTGWITPRYLAGQPGTGEPTSDPLAWWPAKGSPPEPWRPSTPRMGNPRISSRTRR